MPSIKSIQLNQATPSIQSIKLISTLPESWHERLQRDAALLHINLTTEILDKFALYTTLLVKWNKAYNLTSIDTFDAILTHHILDSLSIAPFVIGKYVLDVGSGAGLPGIPLALVLPSSHFVLLDSNNKKVSFLRNIVIALALTNVEVVHARVEKFYYQHHFDSIVTRATSSLVKMLQQTQHLISKEICKKNYSEKSSYVMRWVFMKGKYPQQELRELEMWQEKLTERFTENFTEKLTEARNATCDASNAVTCGAYNSVRLMVAPIVQRLVVPELQAERHVVVVALCDDVCEQNNCRYSAVDGNT